MSRSVLCVDRHKNIGRKIVDHETVSEKKELKRKVNCKIPLENSIHMRYLHQDKGINGAKVVKRCHKFSARSVYRHMKKPIKEAEYDERKKNSGRPKVLTSRDERKLLNTLPKLRKETEGEFTLEDLRKNSAISEHVSISTISRCVHKEGYRLHDKRRKGILTENDIKIRLKFAKHAKKVLRKDIWTKGISFYLDGTGFTHKMNPCQDARRKGKKTWRKASEGEFLYCTGAGAREGDGGRVAKFMVTIAYGKGVTMCEEYAQLNGASFASFILEHFPPCFQNSANPFTKMFLQDGDPSQNSKLAMTALASIGGKKFSIPPRSPDLNPIENVFHLAKRKLRENAKKENITRESYQEYISRVKTTLLSMNKDLIDRTIASMNKRIEMVIKAKGQRIKY